MQQPRSLAAAASAVILLLALAWPSPWAAVPATAAAGGHGDGGVLSLPLHGVFLDMYMYWVDLLVGTPPRPFGVVVDTGSSDFFIPLRGCSSCSGDPSSFYQVAEC